MQPTSSGTRFHFTNDVKITDDLKKQGHMEGLSRYGSILGPVLAKFGFAVKVSDGNYFGVESAKKLYFRTHKDEVKGDWKGVNVNDAINFAKIEIRTHLKGKQEQQMQTKNETINADDTEAQRDKRLQEQGLTPAEMLDTRSGDVAAGRMSVGEFRQGRAEREGQGAGTQRTQSAEREAPAQASRTSSAQGRASQETGRTEKMSASTFIEEGRNLTSTGNKERFQELKRSVDISKMDEKQAKSILLMLMNEVNWPKGRGDQLTAFEGKLNSAYSEIQDQEFINLVRKAGISGFQQAGGAGGRTRR